MSATRIDEIADDLFRIHTPDPSVLGGFSFNQYLLRDEDSLLFHTGPRALFPQVCAAITSVLPVRRLRYVSFGHVEADECGALNALLAACNQKSNRDPTMALPEAVVQSVVDCLVRKSLVMEKSVTYTRLPSPGRVTAREVLVPSMAA